MPAFVLDDVLHLVPEASAELVERVLACARRHRVKVYLVGGPVRDLILARPIRDLDLTVEPRGEVGARALAEEAAPEGARVQVHARFGTASLESGDGSVDLADHRAEEYAHPGALPSVRPGSLEEDLARRDFSVNALALPLTGVASGAPREVVALDDALEDLEAGLLRVLHARSFHDDPTRALRAARLAPRLGFALARPTRSALRDALRDGVFGSVSGDRLRREIDRCFEDASLGLNPAQALRKLDSWHVLTALEPGLTFPRAAVAPVRRLGKMIRERPWSGPRLRLGVAGELLWFAELAPALRRRTIERLALRGEAARTLADFARNRRAWMKALEGARGRGAVDVILAEIDEESLFALYAGAGGPTRRRMLRWAREDRGRRTPVSGADLTELGLEGPPVGVALARIRAGFLDGAIENREDALALAREIARSKTGRARSRRRKPSARRSK